MVPIDRPCTCNDVDQCRLCWLATNDGRYQKLWGIPVTARKFGARVGRKRTTSKKPTVTHHRPNCQHLGAYTGTRVECTSCAGKVMLSTFKCSVHGQCIPNRKVGSIKCCQECDDYTSSM